MNIVDVYLFQFVDNHILSTRITQMWQCDWLVRDPVRYYGLLLNETKNQDVRFVWIRLL